MQNTSNAYEIFVPGGMPKFTYIERSEKEIIKKIRKSKHNLCKIVTVTGQTKSGKTVLVKKEFPSEDSSNIWINAGSITNEDDIWDRVIVKLGGWTSTEESSGSGASTMVGANVSGTINALVAKGGGGASLNHTDSSQNSQKTSRAISSKSTATTLISSKKPNIIIDDFHYLPKETQASFVRAVKELVFDGICVILIAIPHRRYDAINVEKEMTGRVENINIPVWSVDELKEIPVTGFNLLNMSITSQTVEELASQSIGSPHLMQEFCRAVCDGNDIFDRSEEHLSIDNIEQSLFRGIADSYGKSMFEKLAKGPRQRTDRIVRTLKNGEGVDIYRAVLLALAKMKPGVQTIEYEELRGYIKEIVATSVPQAHEVSRVMEEMAKIAAKEQGAVPVIEWEKEDRKLHITDPFFAFYLRWR